MKRSVSFICGFLAGSILLGGGAACAAGIIAERTAQHIFVDGKETQFEAYLIDGHNYLQLRDAYTKEAFGALRSAIVTGVGSEPTYMSEETHQAMLEAEAAIGCWPVYDLESHGKRMFSFEARYPEPYEEAAAYCQPFIDSLAGKTDREKVRQMAFFVCDRIEYASSVYCSPRTALISDSIQKGACMSYAHCFKFLCDLGDIPCIFVHSENHQWNQVYIEGQWWHVDVTGADACDPSLRPYLQVLQEEREIALGIAHDPLRQLESRCKTRRPVIGHFQRFELVLNGQGRQARFADQTVAAPMVDCHPEKGRTSLHQDPVARNPASHLIGEVIADEEQVCRVDQLPVRQIREKIGLVRSKDHSTSQRRRSAGSSVCSGAAFRSSTRLVTGQLEVRNKPESKKRSSTQSIMPQR